MTGRSTPLAFDRRHGKAVSGAAFHGQFDRQRALNERIHGNRRLAQVRDDDFDHRGRDVIEVEMDDDLTGRSRCDAERGDRRFGARRVGRDDLIRLGLRPRHAEGVLRDIARVVELGFVPDRRVPDDELAIGRRHLICGNRHDLPIGGHVDAARQRGIADQSRRLVAERHPGNGKAKTAHEGEVDRRGDPAVPGRIGQAVVDAD